MPNYQDQKTHKGVPITAEECLRNEISVKPTTDSRQFIELVGNFAMTKSANVKKDKPYPYKEQANTDMRTYNHYQVRKNKQKTTKAVLLPGHSDADYGKSGWKGENHRRTTWTYVCQNII